MNQLKILAPVSAPNEVEMLIHYGADELYCGIQTPEWRTHFGDQWWMNRRNPNQANLSTWEDAKAVVDTAHISEIPVFVTLNTAFYPESSIGYILKLAQRLVEEMNIDGLIVSDINLLFHLFEMNLPIRFHLSSLGGVFNSYAVDFYRSLGVRRIILPRQLRLKEIERLLEKTSGTMEFEVFAVNDGCFFEEAFCQTTHSLGPFCLTRWKIYPEFELNHPEKHDKDYREYLWYMNNCGSSLQADGLPNGPCSLCYFGRFKEWGVTSVKIVGREASFLRKMRSLQLVKAVMDKIEQGASHEEMIEYSRSLRNTPEYCDKGYMCYFRD